MINLVNLQKLATFLAYDESIKDTQFDMEKFTDYNRKTEIPLWQYIECHTAGCAIGWAPFAGIDKFQFESWFQFSCRTLTDETSVWDYMFSNQWSSVDNTRLGAAKRIQRIIDGYIPHWESSFLVTKNMVKDYQNVEVKKPKGMQLSPDLKYRIDNFINNLSSDEAIKLLKKYGALEVPNGSKDNSR